MEAILSPEMWENLARFYVQKPKRKPPLETPNILEWVNNPNCMHEDIWVIKFEKCLLPCAPDFIFSSHLLPKNVKVKQKVMVTSVLKGI